MMTLKLPGRITADNKLDVELPEGISPGVVENAASDVGIMHFDEFTRLLELALDEAVLNAEHELGRNLSRNV
jgi:hypothetical protein